MKKQLVSMKGNQNFRDYKIKFLLMISCVIGFINVNAQTLQEVTDNGASTNRPITAKSYLAVGGSFSGSTLPSHIASLSGFQILGDIANVSQNGITYSSGGGGGAAIGFFRGGSYETGIDFYTNYTSGSGNLTHALRIDSHGNLGLGTATPTEKLDVNGNVIWNGYKAGNIRALNIGYSGGNYGGIGYNVDFTTVTGIFNRPSNDQSSYLEFTYGGFKFYGNARSIGAYGVNLGGGTDNLNLFATITNQGNFGIGVTAPEAKLHTSGDRVMFTRSGGEHNLLFGDESARYFSLYTPEGAARATLKNYTNNIDIITFLQDGNVGIGTDAPQEKLSVNGRVRAKEIKVETANWPDYVFADDYQQQTLPELEQFIKKNKHLPEVPSAKEAEKNGVALGEMNKILLKKIEELTLHLIEKDKTLTELTKRVERLEKKN
ncbi:hypothetical protein [Pedobacter chitinilyticus]|uniref:hypothetical protein n=1 Tax=Pedobacter chitinilyticus TaxID=2233776 RepID=UPI0019697AF8|nr:hypothetical protein [Pedobacter chitinilyticus]